MSPLLTKDIVLAWLKERAVAAWQQGGGGHNDSSTSSSSLVWRSALLRLS